ncbi:hypothetical protein H7198_06220, partial [Fructobacillus sp. CRL 2054]|nr:hypothetical protein [Fructobacillus sp. CRL 2054]
DRTGITSGHFSLLIPKEFYQASGDVQDAYIQISDGNQIISTIPVAFTVLENTMVVTQTQSQVYIDTVNKLVEESQARIQTLSNNLTTIENEQKHLQAILDNINQEIDSDAFAKNNSDNHFTKSNTFDNQIIATGGLKGNVTGNADTAAKATDADHATNADNATQATKATTADYLTAGNGQTVGDLTVNGQLKVNPHQTVVYNSTTDNVSAVTMECRRTNNTVTMVLSGNASHLTQNNWIGTIPVGYRPQYDVRFPAVSAWSKIIMLKVQPNGQLMTTTIAEDSNTHGIEAYVEYETADDMPN